MLLDSKHGQATFLQRPGLHSSRVQQKVDQSCYRQLAHHTPLRLSTAMQKHTVKL